MVTISLGVMNKFGISLCKSKDIPLGFLHIRFGLEGESGKFRKDMNLFLRA